MTGIAEVIVGIPHLVAVDRVPQRLDVGRLRVERTVAVGVVEIVGALRGHVAAARWRCGRRSGSASYEVVRTHADRCAVTVVLDGRTCDDARTVADALRRSLVARPAAATPGRHLTVVPAARPVTRPA